MQQSRLLLLSFEQLHHNETCPRPSNYYYPQKCTSRAHHCQLPLCANHLFSRAIVPHYSLINSRRHPIPSLIKNWLLSAWKDLTFQTGCFRFLTVHEKFATCCNFFVWCKKHPVPITQFGLTSPMYSLYWRYVTDWRKRQNIVFLRNGFKLFFSSTTYSKLTAEINLNMLSLTSIRPLTAQCTG